MENSTEYKQNLNNAIECVNSGNYEEGMKILLKLKKEKPNDLGLLNFIGVVYFYDNKPERSIEVFNEALDIDNTNRDILHNLALVERSISGDFGCSGGCGGCSSGCC